MTTAMSFSEFAAVVGVEARSENLDDTLPLPSDDDDHDDEERKLDDTLPGVIQTWEDEMATRITKDDKPSRSQPP